MLTQNPHLSWICCASAVQMKRCCVLGPQLFGVTLRSQKTPVHTGSTGLSMVSAAAMLVWPLTQMPGQLRVSSAPTCALVGTLQWLKQAGFKSVKTVQVEAPSPLILATR